LYFANIKTHHQIRDQLKAVFGYVSLPPPEEVFEHVMRRCVFEDLFSLDQPHRFSRWKTATYDRTALTNNERNNTPFNQMEKQFLTRYFFKDSPVHPNIHSPPFPPINPLLIFVDYFFTLDDQIISVMTIRLNHEGLPPLPVNLVLDRKDRLKPYLPPFITRGNALLTCFPYSQPKTIRVDDINHLYKGSIVHLYLSIPSFMN
jgi:hypothetical protein